MCRHLLNQVGEINDVLRILLKTFCLSFPYRDYHFFSLTFTLQVCRVGKYEIGVCCIETLPISNVHSTHPRYLVYVEYGWMKNGPRLGWLWHVRSAIML